MLRTFNFKNAARAITNYSITSVSSHNHLSNRLLHQTSFCLGVKGTEIKMPVLSPTMTEGKIVKWLKQEGETISPGDVICEVQTDKAVVAMEMEEEGILAKIIVNEDSRDIQIGELIALMVEEGQDWKDVEIPSKSSTPAASEASKPSSSLPSTGKSSDRISPSVRNLLHQYGIDASQVTATGPHNTLLKGDLLTFIEKNQLKPKSVDEQLKSSHSASSSSSAATSSSTSLPTSSVSSSSSAANLSASGYVDIEISNMRRTIAKRLTESKTTIPHAYMAVNCNVNAVIDYRKQLKAKKVNVSVNDIIIKAAALALKRTPALNATYDSKKQQVQNSPTVDISIAVATPNGLITPIVKKANQLTITEINTQMRTLAEKARDGKLQPDEFIGGSFSISNLGMFGISEFSAVINPPQAAILAIGSPKPVVRSMDNVENQLTCTLSYDARVADEEQVAEFLELFKSFLESPAELDKQDGSTNRRLAAFA